MLSGLYLSLLLHVVGYSVHLLAAGKEGLASAGGSAKMLA